MRGRNGSHAARSLPRHDNSPVVTNGPSAAGTPSTIAPGMRVQAVVPHRGRRVGRRREPGQPDPPGELDGFRRAGEERVGAFVDRQPGERRGADLAAERRVGLADRDVGAAGDERLGRRPAR